MTTLNWRAAAEIRFTSSLIPQPRNPSVPTDNLQQVSVAIEGGFLHVDPRQEGDHGVSGVPNDVFIVPAASVQYVRYAAEKDGGYDILTSVH